MLINKKEGKKPLKYSPKSGIEPEFLRPKQNHYIHSAFELLTQN